MTSGLWCLTHLKLCLADAIQNFELVKIIQSCQIGDHIFIFNFYET